MSQNYLTYYGLLGVEASATTEQILNAYREKTKKFHPDKNNGSEVSNEMFRYLKQAKECLIDPVERKHYDELIGVKPKPEPQPKVIYRDRIVKANNTGNSDVTGKVITAGLVGLLVGVLLNSEGE